MNTPCFSPSHHCTLEGNENIWNWSSRSNLLNYIHKFWYKKSTMGKILLLSHLLLVFWAGNYFKWEIFNRVKYTAIIWEHFQSKVFYHFIEKNILNVGVFNRFHSSKFHTNMNENLMQTSWLFKRNPRWHYTKSHFMTQFTVSNDTWLSRCHSTIIQQENPILATVVSPSEGCV